MNPITTAIQKLTASYLKEYLKWNSKPEPSDINGGDCAKFAYRIYKTVQGLQLMTTGFCGGHAWIFDGKKHYDSEHPKGVSDWRKLDRSYTGMPHGYAEQLTVKEFLTYWKKYL